METQRSIPLDMKPQYLDKYKPKRKVKRHRGVCYAVFAEGLDDFYVVTEEDMLLSLVLTQKMEALFANDSHYLEDRQLVPGTPVAARYLSGNLAWYRAEITSYDDLKNECSIYFVDYAHTQTNAIQQLRALPVEIAEHPPMALKCQLYGAGRIDDLNKAVVRTKLRDLLFKKFKKNSCIISFITDVEPYVVRLWDAETGEEILPEYFGIQSQKNGGTVPVAEQFISHDALGSHDSVDVAPIDTLIELSTEILSSSILEKTTGTQSNDVEFTKGLLAIGNQTVPDEVQKPVVSRLIAESGRHRRFRDAAVQTVSRDLFSYHWKPGSPVVDVLAKTFPAVMRFVFEDL